MRVLNQSLKIALRWLIALVLFFANFASALTIEEIDQKVLAKYPTVQDFLNDPEGIELYYKNLEEYFGPSHFVRHRFNAIMQQLAMAVNEIPGFGELVWNQKHDGRAYEIHTALKTSGRTLDTIKWNNFLKKWKTELSQDAIEFLDFKDDARALVGANTAYRNLTTDIEAFEHSIAELNKKQQGIRRGEFWQSPKIKNDPKIKAANAYIMLKILSDSEVSGYLESSDADMVIAVLEKIKQSKQLRLSFEIPQQAHTFLKNMVLIGQPLYDQSDSFPIIMRETRHGRTVPVDPTGLVAYRFKPIPRRIHGIFQGVRLGECVGGRNDPTYYNWLTPRRWAVPILPSTRDYFIEKSGLANGGVQSSVSYVGFLQEVPVVTQTQEKFLGVEFGAPDLANEIVIENEDTGLLQKKLFAHEWLRRTPDQNMHVVGMSGAITNSGVRGVLDKTMNYVLADQPIATAYDLVDRSTANSIVTHAAHKGYTNNYGADMITELSVPNVQIARRYLNDYENLISDPQKLVGLIKNQQVAFDIKTQLVHSIEKFNAPSEINLSPLFELLPTEYGANAQYRVLILSAIAYYKPSSLENLRKYAELFIQYPEMASLFIPFIEQLQKQDVRDPQVVKIVQEVLSAKSQNAQFQSSLINEIKSKDGLSHSEILFSGLVELEGRTEFSKFSTIKNKDLAWLLARSREEILGITDSAENVELIKWIFANPAMSDVITQPESELILKKAIKEYSHFEEIYKILQNGKFPQLQSTLIKSKDKMLIQHFLTSFSQGKRIEHLEYVYMSIMDTPELKAIFGNEMSKIIFKLFRDEKFWIQHYESRLNLTSSFSNSLELEKIYLDFMPPNLVTKMQFQSFAKLIYEETSRQQFIRKSTTGQAKQALILLAAAQVAAGYYPAEMYEALLQKGIETADDFDHLLKAMNLTNPTLTQVLESSNNIKLLRIRAQLAAKKEHQKDIPHIYKAYEKLGKRDFEVEKYLIQTKAGLKTDLEGWVTVMQETARMNHFDSSSSFIKSMASLLPHNAYETATDQQHRVILSNPVIVGNLYATLNPNSAYVMTKTFMKSASLAQNLSDVQLSEICALGLNSSTRYHELFDMISQTSTGLDQRIVKMVLFPMKTQSRIDMFEAVSSPKYQDFLATSLSSVIEDPAAKAQLQGKLGGVINSYFTKDTDNWFRFVNSLATNVTLGNDPIIRANVLAFSDLVYTQPSLNKVHDALAVKMVRDHIVTKANRQQSLFILTTIVNQPTALDLFSQKDLEVLVKKSFVGQKEYFAFFRANSTVSARLVLERTFVSMTGEELKLKRTGNFFKETGFKIPLSQMEAIVRGRTLKNLGELRPVVYVGSDEIKKQEWHASLSLLPSIDLRKVDGKELFVFLERRSIGVLEFKSALRFILPYFTSSDQFIDFFKLNLVEEYSIGKAFATQLPFSNIQVKQEILNYGHLLFALRLSYNDLIKLEKNIFSKFDSKTKTDFYMKHLNDIAQLNLTPEELKSFYSKLNLDSRSQRLVMLSIQSALRSQAPVFSNLLNQCHQFYRMGSIK